MIRDGSMVEQLAVNQLVEGSSPSRGANLIEKIMENLKLSYWSSLGNYSPKSFVCGYCGDKVSSDRGYRNNSEHPIESYIYICPSCGWPTFFERDSNQYPGPILGRDVDNLPVDVESVYKELKTSISVNNYTSALLLGRKLIMHLAVDKAQAPEGKHFVDYIDDLKTAGYIPPNGEIWMKYLKDLGNEKNHEIKIGTEEEAQKVLKFVELLLIFIYELGEKTIKEEPATTN